VTIARATKRTNGQPIRAAGVDAAGAGALAAGKPPGERLRAWLTWTGVAPLGAFLVVHMVTTSSALAGRNRFQATFASSGMVKALVTALVLAPLAFHALYGTYVALAGPRGGPAAEGANAPGTFPVLRHAASLGTLAFLVWHLAALPLRTSLLGLRPESLFDVLASELSSTTLGIPVRALAYLLGLAATAVHLAASLWMVGAEARSAVRDGRGRASVAPVHAGARDAQWYAWGAGALGAVVFLLGAHTVVFFATGSRLVPLPYPPAEGAVVTTGGPATPVPSAGPPSSSPSPPSAPSAPSGPPTSTPR
jgi:succinate dehydrogenase / fumarate reductase cytochrome b subunit